VTVGRRPRRTPRERAARSGALAARRDKATKPLSPGSLLQLMRNQFGKIPNITSTKTTIVLDTSKEDNYLPFPKS